MARIAKIGQEGELKEEGHVAHPSLRSRCLERLDFYDLVVDTNYHSKAG